MAADVSFLAAFFAGILSFLSPCVLPLVPPYLVYLAGTSLERLADAEPQPLVWRDTLLASVLFVAGFSTVFVAFGASASAIGALVLRFSPQLAILAGIAIIIMGLHFLGATRIGMLMQEKRAAIPKPAGLWGGVVIVVAAILAVAASKETVAKGAGLLAVYSAGLGLPFLIAATTIEPAMAAMARFRRHLAVVEKVMGGLLVLTGIAFLTGWVSDAAFWLLEWFPALGKIG